MKSKTLGSSPSGYGHEVTHLHFHGKTISLDVATGIIWIKNQVYFGAGDTLMSTIIF